MCPSPRPPSRCPALVCQDHQRPTTSDMHDMAPHANPTAPPHVHTPLPSQPPPCPALAAAAPPLPSPQASAGSTTTCPTPAPWNSFSSSTTTRWVVEPPCGARRMQPTHMAPTPHACVHVSMHRDGVHAGAACTACERWWPGAHAACGWGARPRGTHASSGTEHPACTQRRRPPIKRLHASPALRPCTGRLRCTWAEVRPPFLLYMLAPSSPCTSSPTVQAALVMHCC